MEYAGGAILSFGEFISGTVLMPPAVERQVTGLLEEIGASISFFTRKDGTQLRYISLGYKQTNNPLAMNFLRGSYSTSKVTNDPFETPLKKESQDHEKDLVELHTLMARNPQFIPYYAWPSRDEQSSYHFAKFDED
jgi:hypothetical protein